MTSEFFAAARSHWRDKAVREAIAELTGAATECSEQ
jgi:hypothetical protein